MQVAEGNQFQTVTGLANFCVEFQAARKLVLVVRAEWTFEREIEVFDMHFGASGNSGVGGKRQNGCEGEFAEHHHLSFPHSAGVAALPPAFGP